MLFRSVNSEICSDTFDIKYECGAGISDFSDNNSIKEEFLSEINRKKELENNLRVSVVGCHRDDFSVFINGKEKQFASQGQIRTAIIALKMGEVRIMEKNGQKPVLLLDDVLSELDENRQEYILNRIKDLQVIITSCDKNVFSEANLIEVEKVQKT